MQKLGLGTGSLSMRSDYEDHKNLLELNKLPIEPPEVSTSIPAFVLTRLSQTSNNADADVVQFTEKNLDQIIQAALQT